MRFKAYIHSKQVPLSRGGAQAIAAAGVCLYGIKKRLTFNLQLSTQQC